MADEFMISGSATAASSAWVLRNGSGGSGIVNGATLTVNAGSGVVTSGLTYGFNTNEGVTYFDVLSGYSGAIGPNGTSLTFQTRATDYSAVNQLPRVKHAGSGSTMYYTAEASGTAVDVCHFFITSGNTTSYLTGTYTQRHLFSDGGTVTVAQNVAAESTTYDWFMSAGTWVIAYSSTALAANCLLCGGTAVFNRGAAGKLTVCAGQSVVIDAIAETFANIEIQSGGVVLLRRATTCTLITVLPGGELNAGATLTPVAITTLRHARGARITLADNVTVSANVSLGQGAEGV
jgi:hypothetical protein